MRHSSNKAIGMGTGCFGVYLVNKKKGWDGGGGLVHC